MTLEKSTYNKLRKRAEARVARNLELLKGATLDNAKNLLHELEVHQIELEVQNEELLETQHCLEEAKDQYTDLFDFAPVGYLVLDKKGVIVNINLTASDLLGVERSLIKGKPLSDYMKIGESRSFSLKLEDAFKTGKLESFELEIRHKNNAFFTAYIQGIITQNKDNTNHFCRISFQDVTTIREAEDIILRHKILKKEKEIIQQYLDLAPIIFLLLDTGNQVQMINQKGCHLIGAKAKDIIGKNWFENYISNLTEETSFNFEKDRISIPSNFESKLFNTKGKTHIISWSNVDLLDNKGKLTGTLMAGEDITERKKIEIRKEQYTQDLENIVEQRTLKITEALHNEKMLNEMKTAFVAMASHEFRTPLTSVLSSAVLLNKYNNLKQYDKQSRHINRIKSSVKQLTDILEDFLSMDKLERGIVKTNKESFNLKIFTQEILKELEWSLKEKQLIHFEYIGKSMVFLDRRILKNVFMNLITNAIKYSDTDILLSISVKDGTLHITFIDKGIGIPEDEQKHLFSKFFRAKNAANIQGTGLGLSIVKHYVNLLKGEISFESKLGKGSKFYISIPQNI